MAILPVTAQLISSFVFDYGISGRCLALSRQDIGLTATQFERILRSIAKEKPSREGPAAAAHLRLERICREIGTNEWFGSKSHLSDAAFFGALGFDYLASVDASEFEGANVIHDMNQEGLQAKLGERFDLAIETGTAEHVFHVPRYLENVCESLAIGGYALHFVPANNFLDHGFYQFSPTLFHDFYAANKFRLLEFLLIHTQTEDWSQWSIDQYRPGEFDTLDKRRFANRYLTLGVLAQKQPDSTADVVPQQRIYGGNVNWILRRSPELARAAAIIGELRGPFRSESGYCWQAILPGGVGSGDTSSQPHRSRLLLFEDGHLCGPAHSMHDDIRLLGGGRYSHWHEGLYFSATDNSDPNMNGRTYSLAIL